MSRDARVQYMLELMREHWVVTSDDVRGQRDAFESLGRALTRQLTMEHICQEIGGVPVITTNSQAGIPSDSRRILYFHGGAFVIGSARIYREQSERIAHAAGAVVHSVDYRLAPEHPFPAAIDDAVSAYIGLIGSGIPSERVVIGGDSAGANLSVATCLRLREHGHPLPAGLVLLSPWVDLTCDSETMAKNANPLHLAQREGLLQSARSYLQGQNPRLPEASPRFADLAGLPQMLIQVGSLETLLDDARSLEARIQAAGVPARMEIYEGMVHEWHLLSALLPTHETLVEGTEAVESIGAFVQGVAVGK